MNDKTSFKKINKINDALVEQDVDVLHIDHEKRQIYGDGFIIYLIEKDDKCPADGTVISFHVATQPDDAAVIIMLLRDILKPKDNLLIGDSYFGDSDEEKIYFGEEAFKIFEKEKIKGVLSLIMEEKMKTDIVRSDNSFCGNC
jgi:hypothetical protein